MGFTSYGGFGSSLLPDLLAIKYGLLVAWDRGFRKVICNSDFTNVIRLINDDFNKYHLFGAVIFYIEELLKQNWKVHLLHTLKEANSCADYMAKLAAKSNSDLYIWENTSPGVCPFMVIWFSRFCLPLRILVFLFFFPLYQKINNYFYN